MLRRLQSSPILGVYVRPWSTYPCGGGKESGSSTLMVDLALHDLGGASTAAIFPNTGNLHFSLNSLLFVPSDFSSLALSSLLHFSYLINHPHLLLPLALDNTKLGNLIPSAPPWTIICPTKLGVPYFIVRTPRFDLGATAISICIIAYPDMKHLILHFDFPSENLIPVRAFYKRPIVHIHKVQLKQLSFPFFPSFVPICNLHIPLTSEHSPNPTSNRPLLTMEELTNNLSANLNLTEIETKIHSFAEPSELPEDENREEPSSFLAVKLLTTRHFNPEAFKKQLKEMWPERFSINVLEKEPNFFTVEFGCFGDRRRVLIGQSWHFDFKLIVISPLEVGSVVTVKMLTSTPTRLCPHVTHPVSLAPPSPRPPTNHIISEPSFNDPSSEYGVQYLHQPRTTPVGCYMTQVPQQNTFIRDINGSNVVPSFSAWPTSSNVVDLDSPSQSRRSVPPSAYPILHDQNTNINNSMSVPEQVAPSNPIVAAPAITNANISDATGYTVPVSQAFATIMADLNANQPLHFVYPLQPQLPLLAAAISQSVPLALTRLNFQGQQSHTQEHIDWVISNAEWDSLFPKHFLLHEDYFGSDHRPLILNLHQLQSTQRHSNQFFFDKLWLAEPDFEDCLTQAWSSNHQSNTNNTIVNLAEKLKHCSKHFTEWKKSLGPSISSKIKEIQHTLKQSWHCRNEFLHHQKRIIPALMIQTTSDYLNLYQQNNMNSATPGAHHSLLAAAPHGKLPNFNLKLTVDAAQDINSNMTGFGLALFNSEGNMLLSVSKPWTGAHSALLMEAHALTYALSWCHQRCIQPDLIVSDCKVLVDYICSEASHHLLLNRFAKEITNFLSCIPNAKLMHISREQNEMAHTLAKFALGLVQEVYWKDHTFICNL
ncbi:hypothetical protein G4B88_021882 [Cannabis sativa]|uniref:RNase H type-1 domain-containing protein n=1 Tax=Cannabis sativa TaxID=3483 RepID=A0A7J6GZ11_CANSA|nr:hypothetical protein G4B88_021882 [Cannabis sativa]